MAGTVQAAGPGRRNGVRQTVDPALLPDTTTDIQQRVFARRAPCIGEFRGENTAPNARKLLPVFRSVLRVSIGLVLDVLNHPGRKRSLTELRRNLCKKETDHADI
jgi:hypothetical protein